MRRALRAAAFLLAAFLAPSARGQELPPEPGALWDPAGSLYDQQRDRILSAAEAASRTSGQKVLVVASRPSSLFEDFDVFVAKAAPAWSDRTIVFADRRDWKVRIVPSAAARPMLDAAAIAAYEKRIQRRLSEHDFDVSLCSVLHDLGESLAGRPPAPWVEWKHPLFLLTGGQDTQGAPLPLGVGVAVALVLVLVLFLRALWRDPKRVLAEIAVDGAQIVIGGLVDAALGGGGGGGGGGSSFGGGGGSSGGGGANGSW